QGDGGAENQGDLEGGEVGGIVEKADEVVQAHEGGAQPEGVLAQHRLVESLTGGPEKEDEGDRQLRQKQCQRKGEASEGDLLVHLVPRKAPRWAEGGEAPR